MLSCVIFNKSWADALTPKFLWCILDIQGSSYVKFHDIGCVWTARLYFTNGVYAAGMSSEQIYATPDFVDLILKLGCMF